MAKKKVTTINEDELPGNSMSARMAPIRETPRRVSEIVQTDEAPRRRFNRPTGPRALVRKPTLVQSIARSFLGQEAGGIGAHILYEILLPVAKTTVEEMVKSTLNIALYGDTDVRGRSRDRGGSNKTIINYGSFHKRLDREDDRKLMARPKSRGGRFDLEDIFFAKGSEATDVLEELCDALKEYQAVSVADFFDIAGIEGATWAHDKWGWEDLGRAFVTSTRQGYLIVFPPPIELD